MRNMLLITIVLSLFGCAGMERNKTDENLAYENVVSEAGLKDENIKITRSSPMVARSENEQAMDAYNKGTLFLHENKLDEAEKYLKEAIDLDPMFADAMDHLGLVYRRQKRYDEAEEIYLRSIEINKKNTVPYQNLAIIYQLKKKPNDAFEQYKKIIEIDPENPESYYGIGGLYHTAEDYESSIIFFDEAIKKYTAISSDLVYDALYYQGINYYRIKKYDEALKCLEEVKKVSPNSGQLNKIIDEIKNIKERI
jgi:tetratricopeptide (TPR) repeat protein